MFAEEKAGRPRLIFSYCLPEAHPSWMLVSHNAMEILFTPGRVTLLGESDGNRIRRIYTDGRGHPEISDPTFHGHSIGHWDRDTLVVDTTGFNDKAWFDGGGIPHTEKMHITERYRRVDLGHLEIAFTIEDPDTFLKPWVIKRVAELAPNEEIQEYVCTENERDLQHLVGK